MNLARTFRVIRHRLIQIELDGYERVGNTAAARRIAPTEARLRAELSPLSSIDMRDAYEQHEQSAYLEQSGAFK